LRQQRVDGVRAVRKVEILGHQRIVIAERHRAFDHVRQLAYVARPRIVEQPTHGRGGDAEDERRESERLSRTGSRG
jgi:hypothetical protein